MTKKTKALYAIREMVKMAKHCFYMTFRSRGTIDFETLATNALKGSTYRPAEVIGGMNLIKEQAIEYMSMGFRVDIGEDFLTIWPNIIGTVKDTVDPSTGQTIVADPSKLSAEDAETKVGCTVSRKYNKAASKSIEWAKSSGKKDDDDDNQDDTIDPNDNPFDNPNIDSSTGSNTNDGDDGLGG